MTAEYLFRHGLEQCLPIGLSRPERGQQAPCPLVGLGHRHVGGFAGVGDRFGRAGSDRQHVGKDGETLRRHESPSGKEYMYLIRYRLDDTSCAT